MLTELVFIVLGVSVVVLGLIWIFIPILTGLPWIPTHQQRIRKALKLVELQPNETLYDLGAGDGRVLILAAREYGARAIGIEVSPAHCVVALLRVLIAGVSDRVFIRLGNFHKFDLTKADVIYAYLTPAHAIRLRPYLESQLRPGTRVVTISADLTGWEPAGFDSDDLIFIYHMPPTPGSLETFLTRRASGQ